MTAKPLPKQIPPYVTVRDIADACSCSTYEAENLVEHLLEKLGGKGHRVASELRIREELPPVHARLWSWFVEGGKEEAEKAGQSGRRRARAGKTGKQEGPS